MTNPRQQIDRAPLGVFHDADGIRIHRLNLPMEDTAIVLFRDLLRSLESIKAAHDLATMDEDTCDCELCSEIAGILYSLEFMESGFTSGLLAPGRSPAELLADVHDALARQPQPVVDPVVVQAPRPTVNRPRPYWHSSE